MSDFPKKEKDRTNGPAVIVIGLAAVTLIWASVVALQAYFRVSNGEVAEMRAAVGQGDTFSSLSASQLSDLNQSVFANRNKGILKRLSIKNAKASVLKDAREGNSLIPVLGSLDKSSLPAVPGYPVAPKPKEPKNTLPSEAAPKKDAGGTALTDTPAVVAPEGGAAANPGVVAPELDVKKATAPKE